jgi:hypothetical protein
MEYYQKTYRKRPLERPSCRWQDIVESDLCEILFDVMDYVE